MKFNFLLHTEGSIILHQTYTHTGRQLMVMKVGFNQRKVLTVEGQAA